MLGVHLINFHVEYCLLKNNESVLIWRLHIYYQNATVIVAIRLELLEFRPTKDFPTSILSRTLFRIAHVWR